MRLPMLRLWPGGLFFKVRESPDAQLPAEISRNAGVSAEHQSNQRGNGSHVKVGSRPKAMQERTRTRRAYR